MPVLSIYEPIFRTPLRIAKTIEGEKEKVKEPILGLYNTCLRGKICMGTIRELQMRGYWQHLYSCLEHLRCAELITLESQYKSVS